MARQWLNFLGSSSPPMPVQNCHLSSLQEEQTFPRRYMSSFALFFHSSKMRFCSDKTTDLCSCLWNDAEIWTSLFVVSLTFSRTAEASAWQDFWSELGSHAWIFVQARRLPNSFCFCADERSQLWHRASLKTVCPACVWWTRFIQPLFQIPFAAIAGTILIADYPTLEPTFTNRLSCTSSRLKLHWYAAMISSFEGRLGHVTMSCWHDASSKPKLLLRVKVGNKVDLHLPM